MKTLKALLILTTAFLSSCSTSEKNDTAAKKYDSPDAALESLVQERVKLLNEKFKTTLHKTGEFSYADDSDLLLEASQKMVDDLLIVTIQEGSDLDYTFQSGVFSMADGGWSSILTRDLVVGKIDTLIDLNGDSGKEVITDEFTHFSAGQTSYKVLYADRGTGKLEKIDTIARSTEPGTMPTEPDWRVRSQMIFQPEMLTYEELNQGRIPKQRISVHSWTLWFPEGEGEQITKRRMWDALYEWQPPELVDVSAQFPITEDDRYQQLVLVIQHGDHDWAEAMLQEKVINLNEYEQKMGQTGTCFLTLLLRFSDGDDASPAVVSLLLKNGADPNAPSVVSCEEGESIGYAVSCDLKIGQKLIDAGSKYALNALLDCALGKEENDKIGQLLAKGADPNLALRFAFDKKIPSMTAKDMLALGASREEALFWAIEYEDIEMVKSLMAQDVKMPYGISSASWGLVEKRPAKSGIAHKNNHELQELVLPLIHGEMFSELGGMEGFCDGSDLISAAGSFRELGAVEYMLRAGANPNEFCWVDPGEEQVDCAKGSALGAAEASGSAEMIELLRKYGARKPEKCK